MHASVSHDGNKATAGEKDVVFTSRGKRNVTEGGLQKHASSYGHVQELQGKLSTVRWWVKHSLGEKNHLDCS